MDRFTKYALMLMVAAVGAMIIATYIGVFIVGGEMETTYIVMIEEEAENLGLNFGHLVELGEEGEYIGFTAAGAISGFIIGYLIPPLFEKTEKKGGVENA
ncbi:hypothetical protein H5T51_04765 [Candidatus Bathyarchaeota archaeon]|nr:hypothetical protein [Candidatus Bathyarchaeota archaeon]